MKLYTTYSRLLGFVITEWRKSREIDQRRIAAYLGIGQSAVSRLERADNKMSIEKLASIAQLFGCKPSDILVVVEDVAMFLEANGIMVCCNDLPFLDTDCMFLSRQQLEERILKIVNA